jgi:hypothetical protein
VLRPDDAEALIERLTPEPLADRDAVLDLLGAAEALAWNEHGAPLGELRDAVDRTRRYLLRATPTPTDREA